MNAFLNHLFRLKPGEGPFVLALGLLLGCNSVAIQVSYIASVSGFLSQVGINQFLIVSIVSYSLILIGLGWQSLIVDRMERKRLMGRLILGFAIAFILLHSMFMAGLPSWLNYGLFYILTEQQWLLFPLIFWVMASDLMDISQSQRLLPLIAGIGFTGKLLGIGLAILAPPLLSYWGLDHSALLTLNIAAYGLAYFILRCGIRQKPLRPLVPKSAAPVKETLAEGWGFIQDVPAFRYLMLSLLALAICDTVIEFQFLNVSEQTYPTLDHYQTFYGLYRLVLTLSACAIQAFLTSRLLTNLTLKNVFLIMPIAMLVGLVWLIANPGLGSGISAILLARLSWDTIDESARKAFQTLVPEERRGRVSLFMDGYLLSIGTILGSLIIGVMILVCQYWLALDAFYLYLGVALEFSIFALWSINQMRATYDKSLLNWRLKRRQRHHNVLNQL